MALRLDIQGIQKAKETIRRMGGIIPIADYGFVYKGQLIHCLAVENENGVERLKFLHYISKGYHKELHPKQKQVNDIIAQLNKSM